MSLLTANALVVLNRQLGAISSGQLREAGVTARQRTRLLADGVLAPVGHWVYRVPGMPQTLEARVVTLCLQHPAGFVTGPTGGGLVNLRRMPVSPLAFSPRSRAGSTAPVSSNYDSPR